MKALRLLLSSHLFLCLVATQVFQQVWMRATDLPVIGLLITIWLSWKLGCLAGHADITTVWAKQERAIAADIANFQQFFQALPESERLEHGLEWAEVMMRLTRTHQRAVALRDRPYDPPKFLDLFPNPVRYFARRRELKALVDLRDSFKRKGSPDGFPRT